MNKEMFKKSPEELQEYLKFKHRHSAPKIKKRKGSEYSRKEKHKKGFDIDD